MGWGERNVGGDVIPSDQSECRIQYYGVLKIETIVFNQTGIGDYSVAS